MPRNRETKQQSIARRLRNNMTEGEKRFWQELRLFKKHYGDHVRRQVAIEEYVVDFAILNKHLIIEIDGEHHFTDQGLAKDKKRDTRLSEMGYRVLRMNTGELSENLDGCVETILHELGIVR